MQADDGGLAGARGPGERGRLSRLDHEADVVQNRAVGLVSEGDVLEFDAPLKSRRVAGARQIA